MKQPRQPTRPTPKQPLRTPDRALRLAELPDTLTVAQFCGVFQISERQFYAWKQHGCLPVQPLNVPGDLRFSNSAVDAFLKSGAKVGLRRSA